MNFTITFLRSTVLVLLFFPGIENSLIQAQPFAGGSGTVAGSSDVGGLVGDLGVGTTLSESYIIVGSVYATGTIGGGLEVGNRVLKKKMMLIK